MSFSKQIAKHFREVHFGGNWTVSNLRDQLSDVTWEQATTKVYSFNTIATLVYHINYYVFIASKVLQGGALVGKDEESFNHPSILSQQDWENMLKKVWIDAEIFANLIEQLTDEKLMDNFAEEKYGNYYRNIHGIIEHTHYHLGQIVLIKKIIHKENII